MDEARTHHRKDPAEHERILRRTWTLSLLYQFVKRQCAQDHTSGMDCRNGQEG